MSILTKGSSRLLTILIYSAGLIILSILLGAITDGVEQGSAFVTNGAFVVLAIPLALWVADRIGRLQVSDVIAGGLLAVFVSHLLSSLFAHQAAAPVGGAVSLGDYYGAVSVGSIAIQILTVVLGGVFWRFVFDRKGSRSNAKT